MILYYQNGIPVYDNIEEANHRLESFHLKSPVFIKRNRIQLFLKNLIWSYRNGYFLRFFNINFIKVDLFNLMHRHDPRKKLV